MREIFISYRRDDSGGYATSLFKDLTGFFGPDAVFMDVAGISPGRDFRKVIDESTGACRVLLALIGKDWLDARDDAGRRRLDDPMDFVRLETASALKRGIPVVPVLVQDAHMPRPEQLPPDLQDLPFRNGVELSHTRWNSDVKLLIGELTPLVRPAAPPSRWWRGRAARWLAAALAVAIVAGAGARIFEGALRTGPSPVSRPCLEGYVPREAVQGDLVCVPPKVRALTAEENGLAASRREPGGGPFGPDTCRQGYVWRGAAPADHVCVPPDVRARAANDNALAESRKAPAR